MSVTEGLILFAHGARDPRWAEPFETVAARVRLLCPGVHVRLAFLEFMSPTLAQAGAELVSAGCHRVAVQPMFLGTGGHVRRDLPVLLQDLQTRHSAVAWALHTAIGETEPVMEAMARMAASTLAPRP
jgi:sirohydrochlorin cobaltochelatase